MSRFSEQHSTFMDSKDIPKSSSKKSSKSPLGTNISLSGSCGDLTDTQQKSTCTLSREDSISSKSSFGSIFPNILRSFDSSGFFLNQNFVPRPEKTMALFDIVISTLKNLSQKYSELKYSAFVSEISEEGKMSSKVENRITLIQNLKNEYQTLKEQKEAELQKISSTVKSAVLKKNNKEDLDMMDCENYWNVCREMVFLESKLERCSGKLQFQIIELEYVSRINAFDQYELSIRLNDVSKFKTKIKIERGGHQVWENMNFVLNPTVDDAIDVKFLELKTLNKSLVLLDKKIPLVNNLILADTSIYTFWLTPMGTVKLKAIVQWNPVIDDPDLLLSLNQIDNKFHEVSKDGVTLRKKNNFGTSRGSHNRLSLNFSSMLRSDALDKISPHGSMENIAEQSEDDVNIRKGSTDRNVNRANIAFHEVILSEISQSDVYRSDKEVVSVVVTDTSINDVTTDEVTLFQAMTYSENSEPPRNEDSLKTEEVKTDDVLPCGTKRDSVPDDEEALPSLEHEKIKTDEVLTERNALSSDKETFPSIEHKEVKTDDVLPSLEHKEVKTDEVLTDRNILSSDKETFPSIEHKEVKTDDVLPCDTEIHTVRNEQGALVSMDQEEVKADAVLSIVTEIHNIPDDEEALPPLEHEKIKNDRVLPCVTEKDSKIVTLNSVEEVSVTTVIDHKTEPQIDTNVLMEGAEQLTETNEEECSKDVFVKVFDTEELPNGIDTLSVDLNEITTGNSCSTISFNMDECQEHNNDKVDSDS